MSGSGSADAARRVLAFWFAELTPQQWFRKDDRVDATIGSRFRDTYEKVAATGGVTWRDTADGCLAAIIVLDQFPRNMFRGEARAFATDAAARTLARHALDEGYPEAVAKERRLFFFLPFEHSEDLADQELSVVLFASLNEERSRVFAERHRAIIERFGRFPHRNAALGRESTAEELAFLEEPDSSF